MAKLGQIVAYALSVVAQQPVLPRWMQDLNEAQREQVQRQTAQKGNEAFPLGGRAAMATCSQSEHGGSPLPKYAALCAANFMPAAQKSSYPVPEESVVVRIQPAQQHAAAGPSGPSAAALF